MDKKDCQIKLQKTRVSLLKAECVFFICVGFQNVRLIFAGLCSYKGTHQYH